MRGLWALWLKSGESLLPVVRSDWDSAEASELAMEIVLLIRNNPILLAPMADAQSIDIAIVLLFLTMMEEWQPAAGNYADNLIQRITFAYRTHARYPTIHSEYRALIEHPRERSDAYRESQTRGSTLFPLLSLWASSLGEREAAGYLAEFNEKYLEHCNNQFWLPAADTEEKFYVGDSHHGAALNNIPITADGGHAMKVLDAECAGKTAFRELSAIRYGHWPIVVLACRHYRLPLPPNLWLDLLHQCRKNLALPEVATRMKRRAGKRRSRLLPSQEGRNGPTNPS